jgi:hypothetical protein
MAAKGQALMDAANASTGASSVNAGTADSSATANASASDNPFDVNGDRQNGFCRNNETCKTK